MQGVFVDGLRVLEWWRDGRQRDVVGAVVLAVGGLEHHVVEFYRLFGGL